jgi:hypothetical protein
MTKRESTAAEIAAWFGERLPTEWTEPAPRVTVDREEITVVLTIAAPETPAAAADTDSDAEDTDADAEDAGTDAEGAEAARAEAVAGRVARFRADTREQRIGIAREAERRFRKKVAWGVDCGGQEELFTHLAVPVMTRLRQPERQVLDTLVEAGVARSRAHALAWCVRLVGDNTEAWLAELRTAMAEVEKVRDAGPGASDSQPAES